MIKIRDGSIPRDKKTYTCWIGNITSRITKSQIENDLNIYCEKFGRFKKPINIRYTDFLKKYQCFIEYYNKQSALTAVNYFRDMNYYNYKLKARYIHEIDTDPTINRNVFVKQLYLVKSLVILNSKYLRQQIEKKVEILRNIYTNKLKINIDNSGVESDLIINLKTFDENIFNTVTKLIEKLWIVRVNTFDLQLIEKKLLSKLEEELKNISLENAVHIDINEQNKNVSVYGFDNQKTDDAKKKILSVFEKISTVSISIENLNI
jgi:hypothetical protein